jgi:hypothetical protein
MKKRIILVSLFIIFLIFNFLIIYRIYQRSTKKFIGEDGYQKNREKLSGGAYIYGFVSYNKHNYKKNIKKIKQNTYKLLKDYVENYPHMIPLYNHDVDTYYKQTSKLLNKTDVVNTFKPKLLSITEVKGYNIVIIINHVYLGASFFTQVCEILVDGTFPGLVPISLPPYLREYNVFKFLIKDWLFRDSSSFRRLKMITNTDDMRRISYHLEIDSIKNLEIYKGIKTKSVIIHYVLQDILKHLPKKKLTFYITFGFKHDPKIYNNVGIIFGELTKETTAKELENQIISKTYQIIATNTLMQILPSKSGTNARNNVDVVFTMMYVKDPKVDVKHCELTYKMIADYPIYVFGLSVGTKCYISQIIMTPEYKIVDTN